MQQKANLISRLYEIAKPPNKNLSFKLKGILQDESTAEFKKNISAISTAFQNLDAIFHNESDLTNEKISVENLKEIMKNIAVIKQFGLLKDFESYGSIDTHSRDDVAYNFLVEQGLGEHDSAVDLSEAATTKVAEEERMENEVPIKHAQTAIVVPKEQLQEDEIKKPWIWCDATILIFHGIQLIGSVILFMPFFLYYTAWSVVYGGPFDLYMLAHLVMTTGFIPAWINISKFAEKAAKVTILCIGGISQVSEVLFSKTMRGEIADLAKLNVKFPQSNSTPAPRSNQFSLNKVSNFCTSHHSSIEMIEIMIYMFWFLVSLVAIYDQDLILSFFTTEKSEMLILSFLISKTISKLLQINLEKTTNVVVCFTLLWVSTISALLGPSAIETMGMESICFVVGFVSGYFYIHGFRGNENEFDGGKDDVWSFGFVLVMFLGTAWIFVAG